MDTRFRVTRACAADGEPAGPTRKPGAPVVAVLVGLLTEWGASFVLHLGVMVVYALSMDPSLPDRVAVRELSYVSPDSVLFLLMSLAGLGFSVLGGYVGARLARRPDTSLGLIQGCLSGLLALRFTAAPDRPPEFAALAVVLGLLFVLLGAWCGRERRPR